MTKKVLSDLFDSGGEIKINVDEISFPDYSAIIDSGSNANGHWVKLGDGTLICSKHISNLPVTANTWSSFQRAFYQWTYPMEFIEPTTGSINAKVTNNFTMVLASAFPDTYSRTSCSFAVLSNYTFNRLEMGLLYAIGRWKE